jgi:hypothetical protein
VKNVEVEISALRALLCVYRKIQISGSSDLQEVDANLGSGSKYGAYEFETNDDYPLGSLDPSNKEQQRTTPQEGTMTRKLIPILILAVVTLSGLARADELTAIVQQDLGLTESDVEACRNP